MKFDWDPNKASANLVKHGVPFRRAILVFEDPNRIDEKDDRKDYGESRTNTIGMVDAALIICVTHTDRDGITRLISARPANRKERKKYHEQNN